MPQAEPLIQTYDIAEGLMRDFKIFPHENEEAAMLEIDEFERGWPRMLMEAVRWLCQTTTRSDISTARRRSSAWL